MTTDPNDIDARLRAALRARADQVTPATLRPAHPPALAGRPAGRPRGRWVVPSLVAAAAVVLAVSAGVAVPKLTAAPTHPATPGPTGTPAPAPAVVLPPTPTVTYQGIGLALPAGWRLRPSPGIDQPAGSDLASACVLRPGAPADSVLADCDLQVYPLATWPHGALIDPDVPTGLRAVAATRYACRTDRPGVRDTVTVAGRTGQHRTIRLGCAHRGQTMEQWVFADRPAVVFVRAHSGVHPADDALVRQIVAGATLPAGTGRPRSDYGRLRLVPDPRTGYALVLDRYVPRGVWTGQDVPAEPRTGRLTWRPHLLVLSAGTVCAAPAQAGGLGMTACSVTEMINRLLPGAGGAGAAVWLELDANGEVTSVTEDRW
jgi:hypothetical protein